MLIKHQSFFENIPANETVTILLDQGYHIDNIVRKLRKAIPHLMKKIQFESVPKPKATGRGFQPVPKSWVIERSFAWMEGAKSLIKNFERTLPHAAYKIYLCFIRLLLKGLTI